VENARKTVLQFCGYYLRRSSSVLAIPMQQHATSSADAEEPRDAPQVRNIAFENACNRGMTFTDTQGHSEASRGKNDSGNLRETATVARRIDYVTATTISSS